MYVGSDGRVTAKRSLATYFTWPEIKRLFWELINVIVLFFKSIFKPDAVAEAENRRRHGCGGPGFTTSGSSGGGDNGSGGGPTRRPMGRINHTSSMSCPTSG